MDPPRREVARLIKRSAAGSESITDEIAISVAADIIEGRLLPGDDLNSVELARTFSSSRTPVREALLVLEREGLVEISAHKRPRVAGLSLIEVRELYNLRAELYAIVSRAIVRKATDADLDQLRLQQARLEQAASSGDVDGYFWHNVEFRNIEAEIAGDRTLQRVLNSLGLRSLQLRHLSLSQPDRLLPSARDHGRLLGAYQDRDEQLAAALTQSLVRRGLFTLERSGWAGAAQ